MYRTRVPGIYEYIYYLWQSPSDQAEIPNRGDATSIIYLVPDKPLRFMFMIPGVPYCCYCMYPRVEGRRYDIRPPTWYTSY